jgi:hypothetical protein
MPKVASTQSHSSFEKGNTFEREWRKVTDLKPYAMVAGLLKNGE